MKKSFKLITICALLFSTINLNAAERPSLNLESIAKNIIESEIEKELKQRAEEMAKAFVKEAIGPAASIDNVSLETEMGEKVITIPFTEYKTKKESVSYHMPVVKTVTKTIAKFNVPVIKMETEVCGQQPHTKTECVGYTIIDLPCGIKTCTGNGPFNTRYDYPCPKYCRSKTCKDFKTTTWTTDIKCDKPKTYSELREIKTDVLETKMQLVTYTTYIPEVVVGTKDIKISVPKIKKIKIDVEGIVKDIVPGASMVADAIEQAKRAEKFLVNLKDTIRNEIDKQLNPYLNRFNNEINKVNSTIINIETDYKNRIGRVIAEGNDAASIKKIQKEMESDLAPLKAEVVKIRGLFDEMQSAKEKALSLIPKQI